MSFSTYGLRPELLRAIAETGYTTPTPIQAAAIPELLTGSDLIGIAQTGTGKTAAFVLPILERLSASGSSQARAPRALIVAPTRELAAQIDEAVRQLGKHLRLRCVTVYGGVGEQPQIQALRRGADIVVATPGRLLDLLNQRHISLANTTTVVLDEADRMLDMGFLPQIRRVVAALPRKRQTLLFSATLSKDIEKITHEFLTSPKTVEVGQRSNPAETVEQVLYTVPKSRKLDLLLELLRDTTLDSVLVFSRTKHGADKIARKLNASHIETATIHSNRSQAQRTAALGAFKQGRVRVLVATDIAARGIDVTGISHVINFDFPVVPEDYIHRIGRTGRAEAEGDAISFVTPEDEASVKALERLTRKPIARKKLAAFDYTASEPARIESYRPGRTPERRPSAASRYEQRGASHARPGRPSGTSRPSGASRPSSGSRPGAARPATASRPASQARRGRSRV